MVVDGGAIAAPAMLDAALGYAERGMPVFPCSVDKAPLTVHGFKDASTDPGVIEAWWKRHPCANIAVATGHGVWVLDVDGPEGDASLGAIAQGRPIFTSVVQTARGRHYWFLGGEGIRSRTKVLPGLDTRGVGGYAIVPPSVHQTGHRYEWVVPLDEIAQAPSWLIDALIPKRDTKTERPTASSRPAPLEISVRELAVLREALGEICSDDYQTWLLVGMALHHRSHGAEWGYEEYCAWSQSSAKYDPKTQSVKWNSFGEREAEITVGTIFHFAREAAKAKPEAEKLKRIDFKRRDDGRPMVQNGTPVLDLPDWVSLPGETAAQTFNRKVARAAVVELEVRMKIEGITW